MSEAEINKAAGKSDRQRRLAMSLYLGACVAAGFLIRAWALGYRGVIGYDETYYYILGRNLLAGNGYTLNGLPHAAFPPLYPMLVGLAGLLRDNARFATSAVSAIGGALLPLPVYFLARDVHGRRAGAFAALAAALWPSLVFYASLGVPYAYKLYAGAEPLYLTLWFSGVASIWLFSRHGGWGRAMLGGVFFGLASLVRSEGPVVFSFVFLWLVLDLLAARRLFRWKRLLQTVLVGAAMVAAFSPFLIQMHRATGKWTLGPKLSNKTRIRNALWNWLEKDDNFGFMQIHYKLADNDRWMEEPYWGMTQWHRDRLAGTGAMSSGLTAVRHPDTRWVPVFLRFFYEGGQGKSPLVPLYAWPLMVAGLFLGPWGAPRRHWWGLLLVNVFGMLFLAVSVGALPRNALTLAALLTVPVGKGLDALAAAVSRAILLITPKRTAVGRAVWVIPVAAVFLAMAAGGISRNVEGTIRRGPTGGALNQPREREMAKLLGEKLPPGGTLVSMQPWIAVWAGLDWRVPPLVPGDRFLAYMENRGFDYALLQPWHPAVGENGRRLEPYLVEELDFGVKYLLYDFTGRPGPGAGSAGTSPSPEPSAPPSPSS